MICTGASCAIAWTVKRGVLAQPVEDAIANSEASFSAVMRILCDDAKLEAAIAAGADYIVSRDTALLSLKNYRRIEIVRPAQFLKLLSQQ